MRVMFHWWVDGRVSMTHIVYDIPETEEVHMLNLVYYSHRKIV